MAYQPSCSNVRVFYPDTSPTRVPFSVMGNADFFLMCAEEPSPTLWVAFSLRICHASVILSNSEESGGHISYTL